MNATTPGVTPLRQRMLDDMRMRKLEHKTQTWVFAAMKRNATESWQARSILRLECTPVA
jgi:hypothetical protein